jgi:transcriptional antiterminator NusG
MGNWFIFFVHTGEEQKACEYLNKLFCNDESVAFVPQVELVYKKSGSVRKLLKPMFPGYVFADSILGERHFADLAYKYVRFSSCIFYLLGDGNLNYVMLSEDEKNFLLEFCNDDYIIEDSEGFIVGDKVFVKSGSLRGKESIIKKINRHTRRAEIELMLLGDLRRVRVGLEIISKSS